MLDKEQLWSDIGLRQFQIVRCVVAGHRGRFGLDVDIVDPKSDYPGFIDFVVLTEVGTHLTPDEFPPIGSVLEAVTLDFTPRGELRLSARPSDLEIQRAEDEAKG